MTTPEITLMSKYAMYRRRGRGDGLGASPAFPLPTPTTEDFSIGPDGTDLILTMNSSCPAGPPAATIVHTQVQRDGGGWVDSNDCECDASVSVDSEVPPGTASQARIAWADVDGNISDWSEPQEYDWPS